MCHILLSEYFITSYCRCKNKQDFCIFSQEVTLYNLLTCESTPGNYSNTLTFDNQGIKIANYFVHSCIVLMHLVCAQCNKGIHTY